jgi:hypothetical protein
MNPQRAHSSGYRIVSGIFALAGVVSLGFIPGVGLLLFGGAFLVWLVGAMMQHAALRLRTGGLWVALALSVLGVVFIFVVDPIVGLGVLLAGVGLTAGIAVHQWLETARDR